MSMHDRSTVMLSRNIKLVKITDTSSFDSFATLDEPRIEPLFL